MAQRAYIIVLEDGSEDTLGWAWAENEIRTGLLETWNNCGYSEMDYVDISVSAEDAVQGYEEGSRWGLDHIFEGAGQKIDSLMGKINSQRAENESEE